MWRFYGGLAGLKFPSHMLDGSSRFIDVEAEVEFSGSRLIFLPLAQLRIPTAVLR